MNNLEQFINDPYPVISDLLDLPILYLSRYITHNKGEYYRLIQAVRDAEGDSAAQWDDQLLHQYSIDGPLHQSSRSRRKYRHGGIRVIGMKRCFCTHVLSDMYPKSGFWVHVRCDMHPFLPFHAT